MGKSWHIIIGFNRITLNKKWKNNLSAANQPNQKNHKRNHIPKLNQSQSPSLKIKKFNRSR